VNSNQLRVAAAVVRGANRDNPADRALRETLKQMRELSPRDTAEISRAVFTYFRWHGWLADDGLEPRINQALELAEAFEKNPMSVSVDALRAKAVPEWIAEEVQFDDDWLRSLQHEPKLWLRAKRGQGKSLAEKLGDAKCPEENFPNAVLFEGSKDLFETEEFRSGEFEIQDIASQAVGILCDPKPGETWWDACAGEGGKTMHLSDLMENKGLIWASDRAEWRLKRLKRRAARAKVFNYRAAVWDGDAKLPTKTKFDGVLVDAPCSGVGTWQRNPHARWTTTLQDVKELAAIQKNLLAHVAPSVKPGGKLIYSVCTLTRSETSEIVENFNSTQPEFEPVDLAFQSSEKNQSVLTAAPTMTIWPQTLGGNGMFIAAWRRRV
jgi:16S rRNA (cytosine967-C5)-methyltransferase